MPWTYQYGEERMMNNTKHYRARWARQLQTKLSHATGIANRAEARLISSAILKFLTQRKYQKVTRKFSSHELSFSRIRRIELR
jgi:hypothetical protein